MLLGDRLDMLIAAKAVEDMDKPGWRLHPVQDTQKQRWAVSVGDNWHLTFEFENGNAYHVDYEDYH